MSELYLGDVPVVRARLAVPRIGVWHAELLLDTDTAPSGAAELRDDSGALSYQGTVRNARTGVWQGRTEAYLVGGADGLSKPLAPRYYDNPTLSNLLQDLTRETGESLASDIDSNLLNSTLPKWTRPATEAGNALAEFLRASGAAWRIRADGTLWVGQEAWSALDSLSADVMRELTLRAARELGTDTLQPAIVPGVTLDERRVSYVEHRVTDGRVRTCVWFEEPPAANAPQTPRDRAKAGLDAFIRNALHTVRYHALFPCAVVTVHDDGTLDVAPDSPLLPSLTNVPIRSASPGHTVKPVVGARCLLAFEGASADAPSVVAFENAPDKLDLLTFGPVDAAEFMVKGESLYDWLTGLRGAHNDLLSNYKEHEHAYVSSGSPAVTTPDPSATHPRPALQSYTDDLPALSEHVKNG